MIGRYSVPVAKSRLPRGRYIVRIRLKAYPAREIRLPLTDKRTDFPLAA